VPLCSPEIKIGRLKDVVDIVLDSPKRSKMISRLHAFIREEVIDGIKRYKIFDNNSINGVIVNGTRVKEAILT
jgi:pSer/pThr/pTyr-binding forkhead associated (FHA) protein